MCAGIVRQVFVTWFFFNWMPEEILVSKGMNSSERPEGMCKCMTWQNNQTILSFVSLYLPSLCLALGYNEIPKEQLYVVMIVYCFIFSVCLKYWYCLGTCFKGMYLAFLGSGCFYAI